MKTIIIFIFLFTNIQLFGGTYLRIENIGECDKSPPSLEIFSEIKSDTSFPNFIWTCQLVVKSNVFDSIMNELYPILQYASKNSAFNIYEQGTYIVKYFDDNNVITLGYLKKENMKDFIRKLRKILKSDKRQLEELNIYFNIRLWGK